MLIFILPIKKKEIAFLVQGIIDVFFCLEWEPYNPFLRPECSPVDSQTAANLLY